MSKVAMVVCLAWCASALVSAQAEPWVATWTAAMQAPALGAPKSIQSQTLRQIIHVSLGGNAVRVRISNVLGATPLTIDAASLGISAGGASIAPNSLRTLTFGTERAVTIPNGAVAVSDPVQLTVADRADLAINLYLANAATPTSQLSRAHQTSYVAVGDATQALQLTEASTISAWYWLSGVDVQRTGAHSVVAFGDSITEGLNSTQDANGRWPDVLARRLLAGGYPLAVVNAAISGNHVLADDGGPNAQSRLDRDMLLQAGAHHAILLEGINDLIVLGDAPNSSQRVIAGYRQIAARAHAQGLRIYAGTLTPAGADPAAATGLEVERQKVNTWLRGTTPFDGVVDFDAAVRDPAFPSRLAAAFDSGDHLHPSDTGYRAMGEAVDLHLFDPPPPTAAP